MKYQNTSGFRQTVIMEGKKVVVFPDDVIELDKELFNVGFEKVEDSKEVTFKERTLKKHSSEKNSEVLAILENKISEVKKGSEIKSTSDINDMRKEFNDLKKEFHDFSELAKKRLDILKTAVQTIEYEVGQLYEDDSEDEKDSKKENKDNKIFR